MNTPTEALERLAETLTGLVDDSGLAVMPADELVRFTAVLEKLGRVVDAARVNTAATIERRSDRWLGTAGLAQSFGYRRGFELLEQVTGISAATARARIRLGEQVCERDGSLGRVLPPLFPVVAEAFLAGRIGIDTARVITGELTATGARADADAVTLAERLLVAQAAGSADDIADLTPEQLTDAGLPGSVADGVCAATAGPCSGPMPADLVAVQARAWRDALDPDGVEPRADLARHNRVVTISRTPVGGLHPLRGMLTPDVAAAALAYFDSLISRSGVSFVPEDSEERITLETPTERRSYDQQRHDLFAAMVRAASAAPAGGDLPCPAPLLIRIDADQLARGDAGTGSISGIHGPVAASFLLQAACGGGTQLLLTRGGKVVKLGSRGRFFTLGQRRAVAARDGDTCVIPGCDVPMAALEAHHVKEHSRGGPTHVDNCVLLCWWHHHLIDTEIWTIHMTNGRPRIRVPIRALLTLAA